MINFCFWFSLLAMAIGLAMESSELIICGFLAAQMWAATGEIIKVIKND